MDFTLTIDNIQTEFLVSRSQNILSDDRRQTTRVLKILATLLNIPYISDFRGTRYSRDVDLSMKGY